MRLIDADALQKVFIEECAQECSSCIYNKPWVRTEDDIIGDWQGCKLIDNAPAIITARTTVEGFPIIDMSPRNTGEWIRENEVHSKCSLCGFKYADYRILFDYCPNCGAYMMKEEAENECMGKRKD